MTEPAAAPAAEPVTPPTPQDPPAPAAAPAAPPPNITSSDADGAPPPATWPDDWRARLAGKDEEAIKRLNRFGSPEGVYKSWRSLEQRMSSGELKSKLPDNATEEQITEWRKENGIPEKADGYQKTVLPGHEWTEKDMPNLTAFFNIAHAANLTQAQVDNTLKWYVDQKQGLAANQFESDTSAKMALEDALRTEWGPEYRGNIALLSRFLAAEIPEEGGAALIDARLADGSRLIDQGWFAKWVVGLARQQYGDASFITPDATPAGMASRKAEIEKTMAENPDQYWKDKAMQAEYLRLTEREMRSGR